MKLGTLRGRAVLIDGDRFLDVGPSLRTVLGQLHTVSKLTVDDDSPRFAADELDPPVPDPRQVFAIGLNYAPHAEEAGYALPSEPMVFTKFPSSIGPPVSSVTLPRDGHTDWEIEVVAVVGRGGRHIPEAAAWEALAGVTLGQDLSERITQLAGRPAQFSLGKSFAGFAPIGPWIVTPDELADPDDIAFSSHLDGEPLQDGRTSDMIFSIPQLVAHLSSVCELLPGDLIFTGTPEGIGNRLDPPRFLQPGETLTSTAEGIGTIVQEFSA